MALQTGSALKAFVEGLGLGVPVYNDKAPQTANRPYVVIHEAFGLRFDPLMTPDVPQTGVEIAQVDLFYNYRDPVGGTKGDNPTTAATLIRSLQGAKLAPFGSPLRLVYAVLVRNVVRLLELPGDVIHYAITCHVWREI